METERLLKLADFLETVPPHKFDITKWIKVPSDCGFAGCAGGWATELFQKDGLTLVEWEPRFRNATGYLALIRFFGLSYKQCFKIFHPGMYLLPAYGVIPSEVAKRIRTIVLESQK